MNETLNAQTVQQRDWFRFLQHKRIIICAVIYTCSSPHAATSASAEPLKRMSTVA